MIIHLPRTGFACRILQEFFAISRLSGTEFGIMEDMGRKYQEKARPVRNVIVLARLIYSSGRSILSGIFNHLSDGHPWRVRILQADEEFTESVVAQAEESGVDGMILTLPGKPGALERVVASSIPTVFMNLDGDAIRRRTNAAIISVDNDAIGREGARHLLSCGRFASFAFVHGRPVADDWSLERAKAFRKALASSGRPLFEYLSREPVGDDADVRDLTDFLVSLPKPAGVMSTFDGRATQVLNVCAAAGLDVPRQIAVIGVDNDESLCNFSSPPLSSVLPDFEGGGRMAAEELESLMAKPSARGPHVLRIPVKKVVVRESTAPLPPATTLVESAMDYIRAHAAEGVTPTGVVRHLGVSRRLAELRFAELRGETIRAAIERERLERVKRLLKTTALPIGHIAAETGFKSVARLSHLFRQRMGTSPLQWRKQRPGK